MTDQQGDQRALADALDRFSRKADELLSHGNRNTAKIEVNAGGVGLWIVCTMCFMMMAMNIGLLVMFINHDRKIDDLGDYVNAIYMMAPSLKPEDQKDNTN